MSVYNHMDYIHKVCGITEINGLNFRCVVRLAERQLKEHITEMFSKK